MRYEEIRSELKTGDMVLFSGKGHISEMIKWFSRSEVSHIGMVVVNEMIDQVGLWESTMISNQRDLASGQYRKGVQTVDLGQRLGDYDGQVWVRQLHKRLTTEQIVELGRLRHSLKNRPYENRGLQLVKSAYDGLFGENAAEDLSSIFCSELFAETCQVLKYLLEFPEGPPSNEYTPGDFVSNMQDFYGPMVELWCGACLPKDCLL